MALVHDRADGIDLVFVGLHPKLDGETGRRHIEAVRVRDGDSLVGAVEGKALPDAARREGHRANRCPVVRAGAVQAVACGLPPRDGAGRQGVGGPLLGTGAGQRQQRQSRKEEQSLGSYGAFRIHFILVAFFHSG